MNCEQLRTEKIVLEKDQEKVIFFDANKEIRYLKEIAPERRMVAFGQELETAMQELFWVQGGAKERILEDGRIKDKLSGYFMDKIVWSGGNLLEINAFDKIQESLIDGKRLVVHFSPANVELGYDDNLVDFWINDVEKNKIKYVRLFTRDNFINFKKIYESFSGKEIKSKNEMLSNPISFDDEVKMADIQRCLTIADKKIETTNNRIIEVTQKILKKFYDEFDDDIFRNKKLIDRIYSGIQEVIFEGKLLDDVEIQKYIYKKVDVYMFAEVIGMRVRENGGSCPGKNITVEFGSGEVPIVSKVNGELVFTKGNKEGLKECKACGYWYAGDSCPLCK